MKVIFLDIDGVLNTPKERGHRRGSWGIDATLAIRYRGLVEATGAKTVISSTWRKGEDTLELIRQAGIRYYGITPHFQYSERAEEIDAWLRLHPEVTQYAILDDDHQMLPHQPFFLVDWRTGLTDEVVWRVIQHFAV